MFGVITLRINGEFQGVHIGGFEGFDHLEEVVNLEVGALFHAFNFSVTEIDIEVETDGGTTFSRAVLVDDGGFIIVAN